MGKHFTINYMISKESVKKRLASEQGISFTEFSYMTMQAYDFLHLYDEFKCTIQGGGSDQWGNITAGMDLIHKTRGAQASGITFPLLTTASGEKFGKSEGNPIWLDPERTSPYQFYQFWFNQPDGDAKRFLHIFTFLDVEEIKKICAEHDQAPHQPPGPENARLGADPHRARPGRPGQGPARQARPCSAANSPAWTRRTCRIFSRTFPPAKSAAATCRAANRSSTCSPNPGCASPRAKPADSWTRAVSTSTTNAFPTWTRPWPSPTCSPTPSLVLRHGKKKYHLVSVAGE